MDLYTSLKNIYKGYGKLIKKFFFFLFFIGLTFLLSLVIVLPMWYLASRQKTVYNLIILSLFLILFLTFIVLKLITAHRNNRTVKISILKRLTRYTATIIFYIICIVLLYLIAILLAKGYIVYGIVSLFFYLIAFGYLKYGKKRIFSDN